MSNRLPVLLTALAVASLFVHRPCISAISAGELAAAEAAIRESDAQWVAAARTASVDAWMAFYSADAVVMAPNVQIASDHERVRQAVADLLALPHLSIAWHPIKVEVARSDDLAYLIGAYELGYDDGRGSRVSDRGKILEIWRRQPDGGWKCIVDTWNSDGPAAAPTPRTPCGRGRPAPGGTSGAPPADRGFGAAAAIFRPSSHGIWRNAHSIRGGHPAILSGVPEGSGFRAVSRDHQAGEGLRHCGQ